jgi:hypothetical protein
MYVWWFSNEDRINWIHNLCMLQRYCCVKVVRHRPFPLCATHHPFVHSIWPTESLHCPLLQKEKCIPAQMYGQYAGATKVTRDMNSCTTLHRGRGTSEETLARRNFRAYRFVNDNPVIFSSTSWRPGDHGGTVVKGLCYKSEGRWFDPRWCHWNFSLI